MTEAGFLTPAQLASRWHMSTRTLKEWRVSGTGPAFFKPSGDGGRKVLYRLSDVERWEREHTGGGDETVSAR